MHQSAQFMINAGLLQLLINTHQDIIFQGHFKIVIHCDGEYLRMAEHKTRGIKHFQIRHQVHQMQVSHSFFIGNSRMIFFVIVILAFIEFP